MMRHLKLTNSIAFHQWFSDELLHHLRSTKRRTRIAHSTLQRLVLIQHGTYVECRKVQGNEHSVAQRSEHSIAYSIVHSNSHCIAMLREIVFAWIKALSTAIVIAPIKALSAAIAIACTKALIITTILATVNLPHFPINCV